jgi:carotenoid cleavage dioxygenase-like enzyme
MVLGTDAIRVLEDGDLETVGQEDYGGKLTNNFTAHPKIDPVTGLNNNNRSKFSILGLQANLAGNFVEFVEGIVTLKDSSLAIP